jgi:tRNA A-37 threonylcarbamoyl transferase component Bud32
MSIISVKYQIKTMDSFCNNIYNDPTKPINKLLITLQRQFDFGYFTPYCLHLDSQLNEHLNTTITADYLTDPELYKHIDVKYHKYSNPFGSGLGINTYDYRENEMLKPVGFLVLLKQIFSDIIKQFTEYTLMVEYVKKNIGITIILNKCVVRIIPIEKYNNLSILYDALLLDRSIDANKKWDSFERIYQIYVSQTYEFAVIVSEKLIPIKDLDGLTIKPRFFYETDTIKEQVLNNVDVLHELGIIHGDVSLDNTGYREETDTYVTFDFDNSYIVEDTNINLFKKENIRF